MGDSEGWTKLFSLRHARVRARHLFINENQEVTSRRKSASSESVGGATFIRVSSVKSINERRESLRIPDLISARNRLNPTCLISFRSLAAMNSLTFAPARRSIGRSGGVSLNSSRRFPSRWTAKNLRPFLPSRVSTQTIAFG